MNFERQYAKIERQKDQSWAPKWTKKCSKRVKIEHQKGSEMKLKRGRSEAQKAPQTQKL